MLFGKMKGLMSAPETNYRLELASKTCSNKSILNDNNLMAVIIEDAFACCMVSLIFLIAKGLKQRVFIHMFHHPERFKGDDVVIHSGIKSIFSFVVGQGFV